MSRPDVYPVILHLTPAQAQRAAQQILKALPSPLPAIQKKQRP